LPDNLEQQSRNRSTRDSGRD